MVLPGRKKLVWLAALYFLLYGDPAAWAKSPLLAVMPLEHLSQEANGYNPGMAGELAERLRAHGLSVVSEADTIAFMVKNRIRWLGFLDSQNVTRMAAELGVDFILLGSVNQVREQAPPVMGATLQLIRAADAKIIWAGSSELCAGDVQNILDLAEPKTLQDVRKLVVEKLFSSLPLELVGASPEPELRLLDMVQLTPEIVQPGERVTCRVRLAEEQKAAPDREINLLAGGRRISAVYKEDARQYEAVWPAEGNDGRYSVMLSMADRGGVPKDVFVGSYQIDGSVPRLRLQVNGPKLNNVPVLREVLTIVPIALDPEPIARWEVVITDEKGNALMAEQGKNMPDRLVWRGQGRDGSQVADGFYEISFTAWDRAANRETVSDRFQVLRRPPALDITVEQAHDVLVVDLRHDDKVPLAYWRIEVRDKTGSLLHEEDGGSLPATLNVPLSARQQADLGFVLVARDILGNKMRRIIDNPAAVAAKKKGELHAESTVSAPDLIPEDF